MPKNPYLPLPVRLEEIVVESEDKSLKTFKFTFLASADAGHFTYRPGQFVELSIPGKGEIPIGIASSPVEQGFVACTVNRAGVVTSHLHNMRVGDTMGLRGPLGNGFPWETLAGQDLLIIGGGFAFTTLRSAIVYLLHPGNRGRFGAIDVVYGARTPGMLLYRDELREWAKRDDITMHITVDGTDDPAWPYNVGFVPPITEQKAPASRGNAYAMVCGPPVMIKFTLPVLEKLGYDQEHILLSLENRMKCGIGMCGRCGIGAELVCVDGPVFTLAELNRTPREF